MSLYLQKALYFELHGNFVWLQLLLQSVYSFNLMKYTEHNQILYMLHTNKNDEYLSYR